MNHKERLEKAGEEFSQWHWTHWGALSEDSLRAFKAGAHYEATQGETRALLDAAMRLIHAVVREQYGNQHDAQILMEYERFKAGLEKG